MGLIGGEIGLHNEITVIEYTSKDNSTHEHAIQVYNLLYTNILSLYPLLSCTLLDEEDMRETEEVGQRKREVN